MGITYNGVFIAGYIRSFSLEGNVKALNADNFVNAPVQIAGLSRWLATLSGPWARTLDDLFEGEVVGRGSSATLYDFIAQLGPPSGRVTYTWLAAAFIARYQTKMTVDNTLDYDATIALSGVPTRT